VSFWSSIHVNIKKLRTHGKRKTSEGKEREKEYIHCDIVYKRRGDEGDGSSIDIDSPIGK
jgi:hypothetical protein